MDQDISLIEITEQEILNFEGVSGLPRTGRRSRSGDYTHPSIKISEEEGEYIISMDILVDYGVIIPQLCYDIQTGIIHSLMERAGAVVKSVNIRVAGIATQGKR